jgi:hypothetical protein
MYAAYLYILRALSPVASDRRLPHEEPRRPTTVTEEPSAAAGSEPGRDGLHGSRAPLPGGYSSGANLAVKWRSVGACSTNR